LFADETCLIDVIVSDTGPHGGGALCGQFVVFAQG
jgi:hypothetical protein